jgi:hypothetical protein
VRWRDRRDVKSVFLLGILLHGRHHLDQTAPKILEERNHLVDIGIVRQLELRLAGLCGPFAAPQWATIFLPAPDYAIGVVCAGKATQERFCICGKQYPKSDRLMVLLQWEINHVARLVCRDHGYAKRLESFAEFGAHEGA